MKIQVPVLGGLRKKVNVTSGTSIAGYDSLTLAQLAGLLGVVPAAPTLPNTQAKTSPAWLTVGPGLQGGGALIGNVSLLLAEGTLPGAAPLYDSDAEDYGMMLSLPGPTGSRGLQGFPIPGQDGEDGMDGFPGVAGAAGATGPAGAAGASGVPGPALWFEADQGEDQIQLQGVAGNTGAAGAAGAAGATGPAGPALWFEADQGEDQIQLQGVAGNTGAAGAAGPAGATGPAGPALWFEADSGEDPLQIQGPTGNAGVAGAIPTAMHWQPEADQGEELPFFDPQPDPQYPYLFRNTLSVNIADLANTVPAFYGITPAQGTIFQGSDGTNTGGFMGFDVNHNLQLGSLTSSYGLAFYSGANKIVMAASTGNTTFTGGIGVNGASVPAKPTGFGTPTGPGVVANFSGTAATTSQIQETIAEILTILKNLGFIGA